MLKADDKDSVRTKCNFQTVLSIEKHNCSCSDSYRRPATGAKSVQSREVNMNTGSDQFFHPADSEGKVGVNFQKPHIF